MNDVPSEAVAAVRTMLVRRCAWCDRLWTAHGWTVDCPPPAPDRETATICADCADNLRAANLSH